MSLRACHMFNNPLVTNYSTITCFKPIKTTRKFSVQSCNLLPPNDTHKLVSEVKEKLEKEFHSLPVGKNGRDDEELILWFLKDRKFSVDEAVKRLNKAIKWHQDFGVSKLSEESVKTLAQTGKAYVHEFLDVNDRPVLVVVVSKHLPAVQDPAENEKLCVFLIEKALEKLPEGKEQILGIFDLRGFGPENADFKFLRFVFDVFYYYYPKRLEQVLFVDAPIIFKPFWQLAKPLLKSYASLERVFYRRYIASHIQRLKILYGNRFHHHGPGNFSDSDTLQVNILTS